MTADREPTGWEQEVLRAVEELVPGVQDWYHRDTDGSPWMMLSYDFVHGGGVQATLRADVDTGRVVAGWSPACLNWDAEMRAHDAEIDVSGPDGLDFDVESAEDTAARLATWFNDHIGRGLTQP